MIISKVNKAARSKCLLLVFALVTGMLSFISVEVVFSKPVSFAGHHINGSVEIYRSNSNQVSVHPKRIDINRNGQMATEIYRNFRFADDKYGLLQYSPSQGVREFILPNEESVGFFSWSNAGAALYNSDNNNVYFIPWGGQPAEIFTRNVESPIGGPVINDAGTIAFSSRDSASHPLQDLWIHHAGEETEPLPDLNDTALEYEILIDGAGRVIQTHQFGSPQNSRRDIMRYSESSGWENLTENQEEGILGITGLQPVNTNGDFIFASIESSVEGTKYWLNLYQSDENTTRRLINYSGNRNEVRATVADSGDAFIVIRTPNDLDAFRYDANSDTVSALESFLPSGQLLTRNLVPTMNNLGDVVFGTGTGSEYSYYLLEAGKERLNRIVALEDQYLHEYALSDSRELYFWLWSQNEAVLGMVKIPEPASAALVGIALSGISLARAARRGRWVL